MNSKRWLLGFLATAVVLGAAVLGFNWLVDPFGVFSHKAVPPKSPTSKSTTRSTTPIS